MGKRKTKKINLWAQIDEYEHALKHVTTCGSCIQCVKLIQSALDGKNRAEFLEMVKWRRSK